jgi:hypothetical protein
MTLQPYERRGRPQSCSCGGLLELLLAPTDEDDALLVCRNPEHGALPFVWRMSRALGHAILEKQATPRRLAAEVIARERALAEIVQTGSSSHPAARRAHGAGNAEGLPPGAVAGVKIGPEDRGRLAGELRMIADELDAMSTALDRQRAHRLTARVQRAFADAVRESGDIARTFTGRGPMRLPPAPLGHCSCGWLGPFEHPDHHLAAGQIHTWREVRRDA